ncbi:MAG TPA: hypothetical protein VJP59_07480 [Gemmatimonadota bacterium]|nr:hypothetical protein [Gemmatimonadota bacterium]
MSFERDWRSVLPRLDSTDRTLLEYVEKLTLAPATIAEADVDALRRVGFGDRMIHDAAAVTGYFAFVNRLADGLGVELEPGMGPATAPDEV